MPSEHQHIKATCSRLGRLADNILDDFSIKKLAAI